MCAIAAADSAPRPMRSTSRELRDARLGSPLQPRSRRGHRGCCARRSPPEPERLRRTIAHSRRRSGSTSCSSAARSRSITIWAASRSASIDLKNPPAELDAEFKREVAQAIELAEQRVDAAPKDRAGAVRSRRGLGLQATYIASVEGKLMAGFRAARRSYDAQENVLELDPKRNEAGLIVGTYRYIVSTLSLPMRRDGLRRRIRRRQGQGPADDRGNRRAGGENRTDAEFALVLLYNREKRYDDAMRVLADLRRRYPRNRLGCSKLAPPPPAATGRRGRDDPDGGPGDARQGHAAADSWRGGAVALQARRRPCHASEADGRAGGPRRRWRPDAACGCRAGRTWSWRGWRCERGTARPRSARRPQAAAICEQGNDPDLRGGGQEDQVRGDRWPAKSKPGSGSSSGSSSFGILGVIAMAAAGLWFVKSHVDVQATTTAAATADFQTVRTAFHEPAAADRARRARQFPARQHRSPRRHGRGRTTLNIMAFDSNDERVVRMDLPFWMLRLKMRGARFDVGGMNVDLAKLRTHRRGPRALRSDADPRPQRTATARVSSSGPSSCPPKMVC